VVVVVVCALAVKLHIEISLSAAEVSRTSRTPRLSPPVLTDPQYQIPLATDLFAVLRSVCDTLATRGNSGEARASSSLARSLRVGVPQCCDSRAHRLQRSKKTTIFIIIFFGFFFVFW
jgi:hypothetical protein